MRRVLLADHDRNRLSRPARGSGEFQSLLRRITGGIDPATGVLEISESDAERVVRYWASMAMGDSKADWDRLLLCSSASARRHDGLTPAAAPGCCLGTATGWTGSQPLPGRRGDGRVRLN